MNKKGDWETEIPIQLIVVVAAFLVVGAIYAFTGGLVAKNVNEATCRDSVFARDQVGKQFLGDYYGTPLLCDPIDKKLSGTDKEITKELAYLMTRCWWMYGQGTVEDPFKSDDYGGKYGCRICYKIIIKGDKYEISGDEFLRYMAETTYITEKSTAKDPIKVTYLDYIQRYGPGNQSSYGNVLVSDIMAPEAYAISYGAPTKTCGLWCDVYGGATAVGAGAVGAKFGLAVGSVVCGAIAAGTLGTASPLCVPIVVATATVGGAATGFIAGKWVSSEVITTIDMLKSKRDKHTIFITTLKDAKEVCSVQNEE